MKNPYDILRCYPFSWICVTVIWVLCLIPMPETPLDSISMIDKWTHFVMYGGLCAVVWTEHAFNRPTINKRFLRTWAFIIPLLMGGLIEVVQATCTGGQRSGDVVDWLADGIGVLIGQGLGMLLARAVASCRKGRKEGASCGNECRP